MRRFRVAEESMAPTLRPGEEFVATSSITPSVGNVVAVPKPDMPDFWLVKRVAPRTGLPQGQIWLVSDNESASAIDSRTMGAVDARDALTLVERLDEQTFFEAVELLASEDRAFAQILAEHGRPAFWARPPGFSTLVLLILEQQVSLESGAAVYRRLREEMGSVSPEMILSWGPDRLRSVGVTRQKATYIVGLADEVTSGDLDLDALSELGAGEARVRLLSVKGIGPWTADAYSLSALRHPDVFPVGDRALQVGTGEVLGLRSTPSSGELEMLGEAWRPIRAVAARLIWHGYLSSRGRAEPEVTL